MKPANEKWLVQIELVSKCEHSCAYCSRHTRHLRSDQLGEMSLDIFSRAFDCALHHPSNMIGIIGGNPPLHSEFAEVCEIIRRKVRGHRKILRYRKKKTIGLWWSSVGNAYESWKPIVEEAFDFQAYNPQDDFQKTVCRHAPITLPVGEMVADPEYRQDLIDTCWCDQAWWPTIDPVKGVYFCEVAGALARLLDGPMGLPIKKHVWKLSESHWTYQREWACNLCGMCIPHPKKSTDSEIEEFSPGLYKLFKQHGLRRMEQDKDVRIVDTKLSKDQIESNRLIIEDPVDHRQDKKVQKDERKRQSTIKVQVIAMMYNESLLIDLFCRHYAWTDTIHIILDMDTTDDTRQRAERYSNVIIHGFSPADGFNTVLKQNAGIRLAEETGNDYSVTIAVDADELIWPENDRTNPRERIELEFMRGFNVIRANMYQVYKHESESPLVTNLPIWEQRRHGDPNRETGINALYNKPIIVDSRLQFKWKNGCHFLDDEDNRAIITPNQWTGMHLQNAFEVEEVVERRIKGRKERMSKSNLQNRFGKQHHHISEEDIRKLCQEHSKDPRLF